MSVIYLVTVHQLTPSALLIDCYWLCHEQPCPQPVTDHSEYLLHEFGMRFHILFEASHLYEKSKHTLCTISEQPLLAEASTYPRPKSITHIRTFSDNGVYVAFQLFSVILVSDQWRRVLIPYSYRQAPWGILHALGWLSRYTWDQRLYAVSEPWETHFPMLKARFLHLTILVGAGIEPPTSWLPGQRVTTRPWLSDYWYGI